MRFYYILFILIGFSCYIAADDLKATNIAEAKNLETNSSEITKPENNNSNSLTKKALEAPNKKIITKKFKPSEEISEDLAIPFPADI